MQKQKKTTKVLFCAAIIALLVIVAGPSYAGERGCITTPGANVGVCQQNIEGVWNCNPSGMFQSNNCSASN
jgi:hypothetical protein